MQVKKKLSGRRGYMNRPREDWSFSFGFVGISVYVYDEW